MAICTMNSDVYGKCGKPLLDVYSEPAFTLYTRGLVLSCINNLLIEVYVL